MLKQNVIRKNYEFQEIIDSKKQIVSQSLIFYFRKNNDHLRVGISVSKKFLNAVQRNRQKRQVRAILDELNRYESKYDIVIILRKSFLTMTYQNKLKQLDKMLRKLEENAK